MTSRWERIRFLPLLKTAKPENRDGEIVESARSVAPEMNNDQKKSIVERMTSDVSEIGQKENNVANYKGYLHELARANNVKEIERYLDEFRDEIKLIDGEKENSSDNESKTNQMKNELDEKDEEGLAALHYATRYSSLEAVKLLVERGADINIKDNNGITPLHAAARGRKMTTKISHQSSDDVCDIRLADATARLNDGLIIKETELKVEEMIEYLISHDASPNSPDSYDQTPLHYAALRGNIPAIRAMLRCKEQAINIDATDVQNQTPLHVACNYEWKEICELLIYAGASVFAKDKRNDTPLHFAAADGNCDIIELLIQTAQRQDDLKKYYEFINQQNRDFDSPLTVAISYAHGNAVQLLLERGANVGVKHKKMNSTVHKASARGDVNVLRILFNHRAQVDWKNIDSQTPLHIACEFNKPEVVEFLLSKKANIEARDLFGRSPLLTCLDTTPSDENFKIFQILKNHGASMITADKSDKTTVILAAKNNNQKVLEDLLTSDQKYDLANKVDRKNNTPLHVAAKAGCLESVKCLISRGSQLDAKNDNEATPLHLAAKYGHEKVVEYILERDSEAQTVRDEDEKSNIPLHLASEAGNDTIVKLLLLNCPENIEARNSSHKTPLDCAASKGHKSTVELLLASGARINSSDTNFSTALHEACKQGKSEMVKLLLDKKAFPYTVDYNGCNCLDIAINYKQPNVAKIIVDHADWKYVMKHGRKNITVNPSTQTTPLRELIQKMPDVARKVLDKCVTTRISTDKSSAVTTYNYELIDDIYSHWMNQNEQNSPVTVQTPRTRQKNKTKDLHTVYDERGRLKPDAKRYTNNVDEIKENHPLMIMVTQEREELLGHPVVASLLNHKWTHFGRYVYYTGLFSYILFVAFLTNYAVNIQPPYNFPRHSFFYKLPKDFCFNETLMTSLHIEDIPSVKGHVRFAQYMTMFFAGFVILKEMLQFYYRRKKYFIWQNLIEVTLYVCALIFTLDWNECSKFYGYRMPEQWPFGVAAAILAWINLVLMVRRFPHLGIYVVMFTFVLRTFSKFFIVFFLFIVAFALAFFMLFQNQAPFSSFAQTIVKTVVMMIGEFEYNAMFYTFDDHKEIAYNAEASQVVFLIFMIIMTILIMNLLVGLAVDDIKTVQNKAIMKRVAMKVELVLEIEYIMPQSLQRKWILSFKDDSNEKPSFFIKRWFNAIFRKDKSESASEVIEALYGDKIREELEEELEESDWIRWNTLCKELAESIHEIRLEQEETKKMLNVIAAKLGIMTTTADDASLAVE